MVTSVSVWSGLYVHQIVFTYTDGSDQVFFNAFRNIKGSFVTSFKRVIRVSGDYSETRMIGELKFSSKSRSFLKTEE